MQIEKNKSLLPYNTFGLEVFAEALVEIHQVSQVMELPKLIQQYSAMHILGGGSNVLLTKNVEGITIVNLIKGIEIVREDSQFVEVCFSAGEIWHECVLWCVDRQYGGIENLSLIPGTIGAAPIQNIGAYGVELKDVFVELTAIDLTTGDTRIFDRDACKFGYRESVFKKELAGKYFITAVTLKLSKQPVCLIDYGNLRDELASIEPDKLSIKDVSQAVIKIRSEKLPDPKMIGNAGSFFKNPVIGHEHFMKLKEAYPNMPSFEATNGIKIPAAWLIQHCGPSEDQSWKGYTEDGYGVHKNQALVLVNYGHATGSDIFNLSVKIIAGVEQKFGIQLEREVNIW